MAYILPSDLRTRRLAGVYENARFVVPTNSRPQRTTNLSGNFVNAAVSIPPYRQTMGAEFDPVEWAKANPMPAAAIGVGLLLLLMGGKRRR